MNELLLNASVLGDVATVAYLITKGADIHFLDDYALRYASRNGHAAVVAYLIEKGALLNVHHNQPLKWAIKFKKYAVVNLLLQEDSVSVRAQEDSFLALAVDNNDKRMVKILLKAGAILAPSDAIELRYDAHSNAKKDNILRMILAADATEER